MPPTTKSGGRQIATLQYGHGYALIDAQALPVDINELTSNHASNHVAQPRLRAFLAANIRYRDEIMTCPCLDIFPFIKIMMPRGMIPQNAPSPPSAILRPIYNSTT
jgi:hypothetical protein